MNRCVVVTALLLAACSPPDRWEDRGRGIERQWLGFDEGERPVGDAIYSEVTFELNTSANADLRCSAQLELLPVRLQNDTGYFVQNEIFTLASGDSVRYRLPAGMLESDFFVEMFNTCPVDLEQEHVELTVAVRAVYDSSNYADSPRNKENLRRMAQHELLYDALALSGYEATARKTTWGWEVVVQEGEGASARQGDELILAYRGKHLDGRLFDDAWSEDSWLYFPWGKPDQVVRGIELALATMQPGERRLLWVTSDFAFGEKGSRAIVAPHTPVLFDLKLVDIIRDQHN